MEWLLNLWNKSKVLFFILLPLIIIVFIIKIFLSNNYDDAIEDVNNAQDKDNQLAQDQASANASANVHKENADKIENKIEDNKESEGDSNWHLKN